MLNVPKYKKHKWRFLNPVADKKKKNKQKQKQKTPPKKTNNRNALLWLYKVTSN